MWMSKLYLLMTECLIPLDHTMRLRWRAISEYQLYTVYNPILSIFKIFKTCEHPLVTSMNTLFARSSILTKCELYILYISCFTLEKKAYFHRKYKKMRNFGNIRNIALQYLSCSTRILRGQSVHGCTVTTFFLFLETTLHADFYLSP